MSQLLKQTKKCCIKVRKCFRNIYVSSFGIPYVILSNITFQFYGYRKSKIGYYFMKLSALIETLFEISISLKILIIFALAQINFNKKIMILWLSNV